MEQQTAVSEVVDAVSPVAAHRQRSYSEDSFLTKSSALIKFRSSFSIRKRQVNDQFEKVIGFVVVVVTQMSSGSSEKQRNICLGLFAAILAVYAMQHSVMTRKVIIFGIAFNFAKLLCFYELLCILKPDWLSWYGIVIVCIIATAYTFSDELKTKFTWCYKKSVMVIKYVMNKVLNPSCKDQASPVSGPPHVSVLDPPSVSVQGPPRVSIV